VLNGVDFIKNETVKLENGQEPDGDASDLIKEIRDYLGNLKSINNAEVILLILSHLILWKLKKTKNIT